MNMNKTCSFTGHRPNKLDGGYDWHHPSNIALGNRIKEAVENLIKHHNIENFISGGALGIDQMSFAIVDKLKDKYPHIKNTMAIPFYYQHKKWNEQSIAMYINLKEKADEVYYVDEMIDYELKSIPSKTYHPIKMQKRNEFMVDKAKIIIAVWDGHESGGTWNCIKYAKSKNKAILQIDLKDLNIKTL